MPKSNQVKTPLLTALVANQAGEIFELDGYGAVGMTGLLFKPLSVDQTCKMPFGSELMYLPDRRPVLYNRETGKIDTLRENPHAPGESIFPVAALVLCFNKSWGINHVQLY